MHVNVIIRAHLVGIIQILVETLWIRIISRKISDDAESLYEIVWLVG